MKFVNLKKKNNNDGNIFWVTMTDLMTGLVLIFVVLFFYSYLTGHINELRQTIIKEHASQILQKNLNDKNINASVDIVSGVVKISDLELFDINSYALSEKGKKYLAKFTPEYFDSIFSDEFLSKNIDKIIIQGHTDSQTFKGKYSPEEQYMKNMELSLKRAYTVANYMTNTNYNKINRAHLKKMIIVEGASYSTPIINNGKEDFAKSRRVELRLIMKKDSNKKSIPNT